MRTTAAEPPTPLPLPPPRDRIIVAELPHHRDHLALALAASLMLALAGALVIVLLPRPPNDVRFLERARTIRTLAIQERERRRTMKPLVVAIDSHRRPARDPLMWTPGSSVAEAIRAREALADELADERADERADEAACDVSFAPDEYGWDVIIEARGASPSSSGAPRAPAFICRAPDRASARLWFQEHVQPVLHECMHECLHECMHEHMSAHEVQSAVTLAFDDAGHVAHASFADLVHTPADELDPIELEVFIACAQPRLAELAFPDAFELTFTWPFTLLP